MLVISRILVDALNTIAVIIDIDYNIQELNSTSIIMFIFYFSGYKEVINVYEGSRILSNI